MKKMLLLFILIVLGSQVCFAEEININLLSYGAYSEGHYTYSYTYHVPEGKKINYTYISGDVDPTANPVEVIQAYHEPPWMKVSTNVYHLSGGWIYSNSHNIIISGSFTDYINGLNDDDCTKGFIVKVYADAFYTKFSSLNLHIVLENNTSNSKTQNNTNNSIKTPIPLPAVILDLIVISIIALRIKSK